MPFQNPDELLHLLENKITRLEPILAEHHKANKGEQPPAPADLARKNEIAFLKYVLAETKQSSKKSIEKVKILYGALNVIKESIADEYTMEAIIQSMTYKIVNELVTPLNTYDLSECSRELNSLLKNVYINKDSRSNAPKTEPLQRVGLDLEALRKYMQLAIKGETTYSEKAMKELKTANVASVANYTTNLPGPFKFQYSKWAELTKHFEENVENKELGKKQGTIATLPPARRLQFEFLDELKKKLAKLSIIEKSARTERPNIQIFLGALYIIAQDIKNEYRYSYRDPINSGTYSSLLTFLDIEHTSDEAKEFYVVYALDYLRAMTFETDKAGVTFFRKDLLSRDSKFICRLINDGQQIIEKCRLAEVDSVIPEKKTESKGFLGLGGFSLFKKSGAAAAETACPESPEKKEVKLTSKQLARLQDALAEDEAASDESSSSSGYSTRRTGSK